MNRLKQALASVGLDNIRTGLAAGLMFFICSVLAYGLYHIALTPSARTVCDHHIIMKNNLEWDIKSCQAAGCPEWLAERERNAERACLECKRAGTCK